MILGFVIVGRILCSVVGRMHTEYGVLNRIPVTHKHGHRIGSAFKDTRQLGRGAAKTQYMTFFCLPWADDPLHL